MTPVLPLDQLDFSLGHQLVTSWFPIFIISAALNSEEPDLHTYKNTKTRKRANAWWGFSSRLLTRQGPHLTTSSKWVGKPGGRTENVLLATHPLLSASWRPFAPGFHYKPGFANYLYGVLKLCRIQPIALAKSFTKRQASKFVNL